LITLSRPAPLDARRVAALAALALATGLGALAPISSYATAGLLGLLTCAAMLVRPVTTAPLLLWTAMAVPFAIDATRFTRIPAALFLSALACFAWAVLVLTRRAEIPAWSGRIAIGLFVLFTVIAVVAGRALLPMPLFERPGFDRVQAGQMSVIVLSPLVLLIVASLTRSRASAIVVLSTFAVSVVLLVPTWLTEYSIPEPLNTRGLYSMWAGVFCWVLVWVRGAVPRWTRLLALLLFLLLVRRYFFSGLTWFSGWAPLFLAVVVASFLRSRRLCLTMAALATVLIVAFWTPIVRKYEMFDANRPTIWTQHLDFAGASPVLGLGPAGQSLFFGPQFGFSSHNNYLDVLSQGGVVALLSFCWLFMHLAFTCWRARCRTSDPIVRAYLEACIGGVAGLALAMMQGDWVIPFAYNQTIGGFSYTIYSWICLGVGLGLSLRAEAMVPTAGVSTVRVGRLDPAPGR
jgi:hypothetical protein